MPTRDILTIYCKKWPFD